ncbi:hypothetical protein DPEC_G00098540 [Dallia pectoralis]|uniref:Uncharacterized protein n=1 Tax=Dallia pectoralis TaxID=75939 RepID=A0ACC2GWI0_DALPE|nr:hypothetical protein DPEC_G00098540 [Dallia pectoralis]
MVPMDAMSGVQNDLDPSTDNERVLQCFAYTMAEAIVQSATYESSYGCLSVQERLAEKMTSMVITASLKEAIGNESSGSFPNSNSSSCICGNVPHSRTHREVHVDTERSDIGETHMSKMMTINYHMSVSTTTTLLPSKDTHSFSFLPQSGLPAVGSLDYPDAPPTTPVVPGTVQSRASFTRKLKGGLAKEFLPSPPPPTPKENDRERELEAEGAVQDPCEDFVERLLRSLFLEHSATDDAELRSVKVDGDLTSEKQDCVDDRTKVTTYAEAISDDIITWMTNNMTNINDLSVLLDQLSEKIITSSLSEVRLREYATKLVSGALSLARVELMATSLHDTLVLQQKNDIKLKMASATTTFDFETEVMTCEDGGPEHEGETERRVGSNHDGAGKRAGPKGKKGLWS